MPTLFYLDAHWEDRLPLREEAELAVGSFSKAVLMIDDFEVPGDPSYAFDDYGPGKRLCLDYLLSANLPPVSIYFPSTPIASRGRRPSRLRRADGEPGYGGDLGRHRTAAALEGITSKRRGLVPATHTI